MLMFDELHDPDPPSGDEHQLNVVLDRARAVRRRRRTVFAGFSVIVLAAGAAIATSITDGTERIATIDDNLTAATQPTPIAPGTTSAPTTEEPDSSSPSTSVVVATAPEPAFFNGLEPCSTARSCSYNNTDDGSLVQLDAGGAGFESSDGQPGLPVPGPALARIYRADGAEVVEVDGMFDPFSTFLLAVNSDDIAYVWQPGEEPNALISAYPLSGPSAGRQVGRWEIEAGQDRFVTTTAGIAAVSTGDGQLVSKVVAPWVDDDGEPGTDLGPHFTVRRDNLLTVELAGDGIDQRWVDVPTNTTDGLPRLFALDSGISVLMDDGRNDGPTPIYLFPDGTFERGAGLGATIWHVLPDGRFVRDDNDYPSGVPDAAGPPLVAVDADGDALLFSGAGLAGDPIKILDGSDIDAQDQGDANPANPIDRVLYSAEFDRIIVSRCCTSDVQEIISQAADRLPIDPGARPPTDLVGETEVPYDHYGYAPSLDPAGRRQISLVGDRRSVYVIDPEADTVLRARTDQAGLTFHDTLWTDTAILLLGSTETTWTMTTIDIVENEIVIGPTRSFATRSEFGDLRFAGEAVDNEVAVHDTGTTTVLSGPIDNYGNNNGDGRGSSLTVIELPEPSLSAWYTEPDQLVRVSSTGTLTVAELTIPGDFVWARL